MTPTEPGSALERRQTDREIGTARIANLLRRQLDGIKTNSIWPRMTSMDTFGAWRGRCHASRSRTCIQPATEDGSPRPIRPHTGQQCILARRLVEAGVDLVTVTLMGPICGRVHNWDDHAVNHHCFDAMKSRAGYFDQAVTTLIEDVYERGLDKRVMVLVTGEFGRTPKISYAKDSASGVMQPGRDHWPSATSMLFAGGGLRTGQVIGGTDRRGEQVIERASALAISWRRSTSTSVSIHPASPSPTLRAARFRSRSKATRFRNSSHSCGRSPDRATQADRRSPLSNARS
jgi:hypothetical protein